METWNDEIVDKSYYPHDNFRLRIEMSPSGENEITLVTCTADSLYADTSRPEHWKRTFRDFS